MNGADNDAACAALLVAGLWALSLTLCPPAGEEWACENSDNSRTCQPQPFPLRSLTGDRDNRRCTQKVTIRCSLIPFNHLQCQKSTFKLQLSDMSQMLISISYLMSRSSTWCFEAHRRLSYILSVGVHAQFGLIEFLCVAREGTQILLQDQWYRVCFASIRPKVLVCSL